MWRYGLIVAGACLGPFVSAPGLAANQAANRASDQTSNLGDASFSSKDFHPPGGFGGYGWNTPLGKINRLVPEPVYVRVAYSKGKIIDFDSSCFQNVMDPDDNGVPNINGDYASALSLCRKVEGEGYYAMAEYYVDSQGFRISDAAGKAVLFPVTYQFCSHWKGFSSNFKGDPIEQLQLCGARLHFRSETAAQEKAIQDPMYRTAYDRTLNWLIKTYGQPEGLERDGVVLIPTLETEPSKASTREGRHQNKYWCRPKGEALVPTCDASIVLAFDAETGRGQVIYLTANVWTYAYARQFGSAEGDPLYQVLHGGAAQPSVQHQCMEGFLCRPAPPAKMPEEMLARFRLSNNDKDAKQ